VADGDKEYHQVRISIAPLHMLIHYYLAQKSLTKLIHQGHNHPGFKNFQESLSIPELDVEHQKAKCMRFFKLALEPLNKHFERWVQKDLLPCGLMLELPLAKLIAQVIQQQPQLKKPPNTTVHPFKSQVHKQNIDLYSFELWFNKKVAEEFGNKTSDELFQPIVLEAANKITCAYQVEVNMAKEDLAHPKILQSMLKELCL
jgi:hypothetical protein